MELTNCQTVAKRNISNFLNNNSGNNIFLLKGSAGTGKSTVITNILDDEKYNDKKIAFCASTNKAVSILKQMFNVKNKKEVVFLTIHKLLKIKRKIDKNGKELFETEIDKEDNKLIKSKSIFYYDIIIVDESSMISEEILTKILDIKERIKGKIIFVGDIAQLPPVNEDTSYVFRFKDIEKSELKEIVRYKGNIVSLCDKIRDLVFDSNTKFSFKKFTNDDIKIYKVFNLWLNEYLKYLNDILLNDSSDNKMDKIPIFIVYTNKQCDNINLKVRRNLFGNISNKFVIGEIIIFNNYYYSVNKNSYYTSQKSEIKNLKIINRNYKNVIDVTKLKLGKIFEKINEENILDNMTTTSYIQGRLDTFYTLLENLNVEVYELEILGGDIIYTLYEKDIEKFNNTIEFIKELFKKLGKYLSKRCKNFKSEIMTTLWEIIYQEILDKLADICYGYCITTHKSQASTFDNIFVDMNNIITKNSNVQESYRCLYTALTRTSKKLNILI